MKFFVENKKNEATKWLNDGYRKDKFSNTIENYFLREAKYGSQKFLRLTYRPALLLFQTEENQ